MSEYRYETVIIGAGPAGMGAAIPLAKRQANVCVIDRATFPRNKACAGLVTGKTYRLIRSLFDGGDVEKLFCFVSGEVRLFRRTQLLVSAPLEHEVRLVNRSDFDNALVKEYRWLGGILLEGENGVQLDWDNSCVRLKSGDTIYYKTILFADGARSLAHQLVHVPRNELALGIEAYLPASAMKTDSIDLYFGYLKSGYVWVFPHGDSVCIGAAERFAEFTDWRGMFTEILADLGVKADGAKYIGAYLPYGDAVPQEYLPDSMMLLGDAGGFADPISGEGLYMALQTGAYAAQALQEEHPKQAYLDSLQALRRIISDGKKVQKTFYSPMIQKVFTGKVKGRSGLVSHFFEQMVEDYRCEYRDLPKLYGSYKKDKKES